METEHPSAQTRALNTIELFENVLLHARIEDVLSCQRVCKDWYAVTGTSPKLKQKLFLEPMTTRTKISFGYTTTDTGRNVDGSKITEEVPVSEFVALSTPKSDDRDEAILASLHPLLSSLPNQLSHHHVSTKHGHVTHMLVYQDGEWLDMFATQPPVETVWVTCIVYDSPPRSYYQHEHRISKSSGVRLRDIRDQLQVAVECNYQYEQSMKLLKPPHYNGDDCHTMSGEAYAETHEETLRLVGQLDWTRRQHVLTQAGAGTVTLAVEIPGCITRNALWTRLAQRDIGTEQFEDLMAE